MAIRVGSVVIAKSLRQTDDRFGTAAPMERIYEDGIPLVVVYGAEGGNYCEAVALSPDNRYLGEYAYAQNDLEEVTLDNIQETLKKFFVGAEGHDEEALRAEPEPEEIPVEGPAQRAMREHFEALDRMDMRIRPRRG